MLQSNSHHYPSDNGKTEKQQIWTCQTKAFIPPNICLEDKASHWLAGDLFIFPSPSRVWEPEEGQGDSVCQGKAGRDNEGRFEGLI